MQSQKEETPRGRLALDGATVALGDSAKELVITDASGDASYLLRAQSEEERDRWIDWINISRI